MAEPMSDEAAMATVPLVVLAHLLINAIRVDTLLAEDGKFDVEVRLAMIRSTSMWGMRRWAEGVLTANQAISTRHIENDAARYLRDHPAEVAEYEQMLAAYADEQVRGE